MTVEALPYSYTRAARELGDALKAYTARKPGGLRALAAELGLKQATVLSHMANGRMAIPIDRATALATTLGMDVPGFCLAVLEQRAPDVYRALDQAFGVSKFGDLTMEQREIIRGMINAKGITGEHVSVVDEVIHARRPRERWLAPLETGIMRPIRDHFPGGVPYNEIEPLAAAIEAHLSDQI